MALATVWTNPRNAKHSNTPCHLIQWRPCNMQSHGTHSRGLATALQSQSCRSQVVVHRFRLLRAAAGIVGPARSAAAPLVDAAFRQQAASKKTKPPMHFNWKHILGHFRESRSILQIRRRFCSELQRLLFTRCCLPCAMQDSWSDLATVQSTSMAALDAGEEPAPKRASSAAAGSADNVGAPPANHSSACSGANVCPWCSLSCKAEEHGVIESAGRQ